jgi:hypothetical protein
MVGQYVIHPPKISNGNAHFTQVALVYGFFFCFIGTLCTCASLAEYASMYVVHLWT